MAEELCSYRYTRVELGNMGGVGKQSLTLIVSFGKHYLGNHLFICLVNVHHSNHHDGGKLTWNNHFHLTFPNRLERNLNWMVNRFVSCVSQMLRKTYDDYSDNSW